MDYIHDLSDIGPSLRALRQSRGLTQAALAERAGLSRTRLSLIEGGGAQNIEVATLLRLLAALGAYMSFERGGRPNLNQILRQRQREAGGAADAEPEEPS